MKAQIVCLLAAVAAMCSAEVVTATPGAVQKSSKVEKAKLSSAEREAKRQEWLKKTGGVVVRRGKGKISVVNCQNVIFDEVIKTQQVNLAQLFRINVDVNKGSWRLGDKPANDAIFTIYLIDDPSLPVSLIAHEERWGLVNCHILAEKRRFNKVFVHTAVCLLDGSASQMSATLMKPAATLADYDKTVNEAVPFDLSCRITRNLAAMGFVQAQFRSYRRACMEGWAPAPTNEIQKAIWDEVHELPTDPIKIKFDPKRDAGK